jgi:drug/metabolite transporter (DMT)-like permease
MTTQTTTVSALPDRNILLPFAVFILLVGGAPVAIKIGYSEMAPFWMGVARFGLGALVFWGLAFYKGLKLPQGRALLGAVLHGTLGVGVSFVLISWGLVKTQASMASILLALIPLMTLLLSSLQGVESFSWRGILGALLAIAGTAIAVGGASAENISLPHIGAIVLATAFSAQSSVVIKRFPPNPPIMTNAISMTVGSIILVIASLVTRETWALPTQTNTWMAFGYLVLFVTIFAFVLYLQVLAKWTASGTSYGFVVIPLVTVIVAAVLTDEHITAAFLVGAVLVISGVLVGALLPSKDKAEAVEECKDRSGQVLPRCY